MSDQVYIFTELAFRDDKQKDASINILKAFKNKDNCYKYACNYIKTHLKKLHYDKLISTQTLNHFKIVPLKTDEEEEVEYSSYIKVEDVTKYDLASYESLFEKYVELMKKYINPHPLVSRELQHGPHFDIKKIELI